MSNTLSVTVVGGGLVGALAAVTLAQKGWDVNVYELREDVRLNRQNQGRSINLALSVRGLAALEEAGVDKDIIATLIPMKGRLIHDKNGKLSTQSYGAFGECINSVDRQLINDHLLDMAERMTNVKLHFLHTLVSTDFDAGVTTFLKKDGTKVSNRSDLIIGADGVHSKVRSFLQRKIRMNFAQEYIDHAWLELTIPAGPDGKALMDESHLHIWPRQTFMMIALPNTDHSFTVTLFMPFSKFESITNEAELLEFFQQIFPDSIGLMGKQLLIQEFFKNPRGPLCSIKCSPYHYKHRVVIIGDSAHSMVPFYGQGMNCGFEDVSVISKILDTHIAKNGGKPTALCIEAALTEYTNTRGKDAHAMCDLALHNYEEMRSSITKISYKVRKSVEGFFHRLAPSLVIPLYTMVSFSRIPYSEVVRRWNAQTFWLTSMAWSSSAILAIGVFALVRRSVISL